MLKKDDKRELAAIDMDIRFRKITEFPRGTLAALLKDAYGFEPKFERDWLKQWQAFDDFFYDNPHIAETCGFMTVLEEKPIGFVSWNPTNLPVSAEVGHNCIMTRYKGKGYGKRQMREAVQRMIAQGAEKVNVWTNEICVPAQHTYESVGFQLIGKSEESFCQEYAGQRMHYEIAARTFRFIAQLHGATERSFPAAGIEAGALDGTEWFTTAAKTDTMRKTDLQR